MKIEDINNTKIIRDLTGIRFGMLVVTSRNLDYKYCWNCDCDCGKKSIVSRRHLTDRKKGTRSCGCQLNKVQKSEVGNKNRRWKGAGDIRGIYFYQLSQSAKKRGIEFNITVNDVWNKFLQQNKKCNLTGLEIRFEQYQENKLKQTASVDRINPDGGYTLDNIQIIHKDLNVMKMDFSQEEFINYCRLVTEKFTNKN